MTTTAPLPETRGHLDPAIAAEIEKFAWMLEQNRSGAVDDETFRVYRLGNGIYGQRQGGTNQMVRVKVPYGSLTPEQLEALGRIATEYSRGWGHITTRQNIQFHFVELDRVVPLLWDLAAVGLHTREACGDTVRNVTACHLSGACPYEVLDVSPWAEAAYRHFLRHPYGQRLPRKFKINFSGCATDCGQAMFNDVGVVAVNRALPDGTTEAGFRVFVAGGLGANPHAAIALEDFTPKEQLLPTIEAALRTFDHYGNRDNKLRARMKWLLETLGPDEIRRRVLRERKTLPAAVNWPGPGIPDIVRERGDTPAGASTEIAPTPVGSTGYGAVPVRLLPFDPYGRWEKANVVRGAANGTTSAVSHCPLGDVTAAQFAGLAALARRFEADVRVTNRQNFVFRDLAESDLRPLHEGLADLGLDRPGAELARDVVACPGADTCNLAVTQSRGLAADIGEALEEAGLADVGDVRINISACPNSCGQHHISDIGLMGAERRAHGRSAPGYQMLLGGHLGTTEVEFGRKALRLPAKATSAAVVRVVGRFAAERHAGEAFPMWLERAGGAAAVGGELADLGQFPLPDDDPSFYVDYDETGPYAVVTGQSECAT